MALRTFWLAAKLAVDGEGDGSGALVPRHAAASETAAARNDVLLAAGNGRAGAADHSCARPATRYDRERRKHADPGEPVLLDARGRRAGVPDASRLDGVRFERRTGNAVGDRLALHRDGAGAVRRGAGEGSSVRLGRPELMV